MQQQPPQPPPPQPPGQQLSDGPDQLSLHPTVPPQQPPSAPRLPGDPRQTRTALAVPTGPAVRPKNHTGPGIYELARSPPNAANKAGTKHGNCKFGAKCALAHILPDGRRVNRHNVPTPMAMPAGGAGFVPPPGRANQLPFQGQEAALNSPLPAQQPVIAPTPPNGRPVYPYPAQEPTAFSYQQQFQSQGPSTSQLSSTPKYTDIPIIDHSFTDRSIKLGSPADDHKYAMPSLIGRTALDAPLPASFDSQGVSYLARNGPIAASVPSTFGLDIVSPSALSRHLQRSADVLRLNDPVFGKPVPNMASSPLDASVRQPYLQRIAKPQMISASVPRPSALSSQLDEWGDDNFAMEEDYLPMSLHDDVLTPQERMRRLSRTEQDNGHRGELSNLNIFGGASSAPRVGSPLASSPSRFGALFAKQRQKKEEEALSASMGHLGSPRRDASLLARSNLVAGSPLSSNGDPFSGIRTSVGVSAITEQLGRTSLHHAVRSSASTKLDRVMTSSPHSATIDEENENDLVFSMEEEDHKHTGQQDSNDAWMQDRNTVSTSHKKESDLCP
ncbi:hypothetical protein KEM56_001735 [Ascosphaera pollenicola]|nr:hypothetical protein KEM56_001735 [Ascosphaera pollenicola]